MTSFSRGDIVLVKFVFADEKGVNQREAGLPHPSVVTGILRTIKHEMIARTLGGLPAPELRAVEEKLRQVLEL